MVTISATQLTELLKDVKVKVLEATMVPFANPTEDDLKDNCRKFFENAANRVKCPNYQEEHIPGAVEFSLNVACPTGKFARFDIHPPQIFQSFIESLGLNKGDRIVFYARGPFGGMLFASRAYWLMKLYGIQSTILDGGLAAWKSEGKGTDGETVKIQKGQWDLGPLDENILISFEELNRKDGEGENMFDHLEKVNFLDCRPADQFSGAGQTHFQGDATGSRCRGARSLPIPKICDEKGLFTEEKIKEAVRSMSLVPGAPAITSCLTGIQASALFVALEKIGVSSRVYNGSMTELLARASHLVNEKNE